MSASPVISASRLALLGGTAIGKVGYPQHPKFSERAIQRATDVLRAGKATGLGRFHSPEIVEVEAALSRYHGGRHVLATASGHGALQSALAGLEICSGDEVITTPYTWGASVSCILHQNAVPVFADVDPVTGLLDPKSVEAAITPRTKAILVVHIFGQPADLRQLRAIADRHKIMLVEDGSQAHGAMIDGLLAGNVGDAAGFSCMGGKVLATTEAGYMVTPHERAFWKGCMTGQHMGRSPDQGFPDDLRPFADSLVYTHRISPLNAVLLFEQLQSLDAQLAERRRHADLLRSKLAGARFMRLPDYPATAKPSYHLLTTTFDAAAAGVTRNTFIAALRAEGLFAFPYVPSPVPDWPRLHWQDYRGPRVPWLPALERSGRDYRGLALPGCRAKVANSIETRFDFGEPSDGMIDLMAEIILKVESNIADLRDHERKSGPAAPARRV